MSDEHDVRPVTEPVVSSGGFPFSDPRAWLPAVLLLALAAGLAYYARTLDEKNASLQQRLEAAVQDTEKSRQIAANAEEATEAVHRTMAIVTAADMRQLDLFGQSAAPASRARVFWSRQHGLVFTSTSLPPVPKGKVYQVWVLSSGTTPFNAGLLTPNEAGAATVIYSTPPDIAQPTGMAVSLEAGEAASPTSNAIFLIGDLRD